MAGPQSCNRYDMENIVTVPRPSAALRLLARLRFAARIGLVAGLDATTSNASPPTPIRKSNQSID
jgi:hypothetical protein